MKTRIGLFTSNGNTMSDIWKNWKRDAEPGMVAIIRAALETKIPAGALSEYRVEEYSYSSDDTNVLIITRPDAQIVFKWWYTAAQIRMSVSPDALLSERKIKQMVTAIRDDYDFRHAPIHVRAAWRLLGRRPPMDELK